VLKKAAVWQASNPEELEVVPVQKKADEAKGAA